MSTDASISSGMKTHGFASGRLSEVKKNLIFNVLSISVAQFQHINLSKSEIETCFHKLADAGHSLGKGEVLSSILSGSTSGNLIESGHNPRIMGFL